MAKTPAQRAAIYGGQATPPNTPVVNTTTSRTPEQAQGNANLILIAGGVASLFLFWYFHILVLGQMTDLSGGLAMPDSMVFGFDVHHVEALRAAMNADANGQLQFVHKTAGLLFPLAVGFTSMTLIAVNVAKRWLCRLLWAFPVLFAAVQIWANVSIDNMLGGKHLDTGLVAVTSVLVVSSWALLLATLLAMVVALFVGRRRKVASDAADGAAPSARGTADGPAGG